jgi:hypothetical protein
MTRLATEQQAADAIGLDLATFRHWVACGRLPKPLPDAGLFDTRAIDIALDKLSGIGSPVHSLDAWREKRHAG